MSTIVLAADDEGDLRSRKRIVMRIGGLVLACAAIVFQQEHDSFRWNTPVAHADSPTENVCALKDDFSKFLDEDAPKVVSAADGCGVNREAFLVEDTSVFAQELSALVSGYPIEAMVPEIAKKDRSVAAFLVGIAKKESDWGEHVPTKDGQDCYNYWGYKGEGGRGSGMGYACFGSPQEAVQVVGDRIFALVYEQHRNAPAKMLVWKCGSSCEGHSSEGVRSWIGTVDMYYRKIAMHSQG